MVRVYRQRQSRRNQIFSRVRWMRPLDKRTLDGPAPWAWADPGNSPRVTSAVLDHVAELSRLGHLGVWLWRVEDDDLEQLRQMPNLTSLDLRTNLTDESVRHLLPLERLKQLTLIGDGITDASVPLSCRLRNLTWLDLSDTSIQKNGDAARMLKQALPACRIRLPKTEREREAERIFTRQRFEVDRRSSQD